ncbi:MAG: transporter [Methylotenera sp.]|nr:MAG: transporter [Methylotenera sp.]
MKTLQKIQLISMLLFFCGLTIGCAKEKYIAKPLDAEQISAKILNKNLSDDGFKAYLAKQGYAVSEWPIQQWGLDELTYAALYFNPKLDVAKAQLALANTSIITANQRQNPTLGATSARSNRANGDISPWSYGLDVSIPVVTNNKREIQVEEAERLRDAAQLSVAEIAWQLRSQIAKDLMAYHENIAAQQALSQELNTHASIINMLEKRVELGLLATTALNDAKLSRQKTEIASNLLSSQLVAIRGNLATDTGLNLEQLNTVSIKPIQIDAVLNQESTLLNTPEQLKILQQNALLNRLDIRRSLAKYAAAEAKIKLEVAKQTPDIALTPGYLFEFGDRIWSLGFSSLINLLNKNQTLIAEATNLREIEGAQFEALQTNIIGELNLAYANYQSSLQQMHQTQLQLNFQANQQQNLQNQFDKGLIDRLVLTQNKLFYLTSEQQLLRLQFNCLKAAIHIEDLMQRPLFDASKNDELYPLLGLKP